MTVKTLTGSSIQDALAKAREKLGDDVVLMESSPATADSPAEIAVVIDAPVADTAQAQTSNGHVPKPPDDGQTLSVPDLGSGSSSSSSFQGGGIGTKSPGREAGGGASRPGGDGDEGTDDGETDDGLPDGRDFGKILEEETNQTPGRGQIFPNADSQDDPQEGGGMGWDLGESSRTKERPRSHPRSRNAKRWSQHPIYDLLLEKGLRRETVNRLFDELSNHGVSLNNAFPGELRWAFAQLLFQRIDIAGPDRGRDNIMLIGPGGAGKTSLILKMATHDHLLVGGKPVVLHIQPDADRVTDYQNPTPLYERFGVPVRNVRTKADVGEALRHTEQFGRILVDTPPLPLPLKEGRSVLRRMQSLLRPLRPLDVHFVLDGTRALENLDPTALPHLPVRPSTVAMTHLDEVSTWGRLVEWLITLEMPIQFASGGAEVPDGVRVFSLEWFAEDIMDL